MPIPEDCIIRDFHPKKSEIVDEFNRTHYEEKTSLPCQTIIDGKLYMTPCRGIIAKKIHCPVFNAWLDRTSVVVTP